MKISYRRNVWDNYRMYVGQRRDPQCDLIARTTESWTRAAKRPLELAGARFVVLLPGHPALPVNDEVDAAVVEDLLYRKIAAQENFSLIIINPT